MNKKVSEQFKDIKDIYLLQCICTEQDEEIERLQEELDKTRLSELDKEYRINKAIEEIKQELKGNKIDNIDGYAKATLIDLLRILKGSDKE